MSPICTLTAWTLAVERPGFLFLCDVHFAFLVPYLFIDIAIFAESKLPEAYQYITSQPLNRLGFQPLTFPRIIVHFKSEDSGK